jgi:hypothetical protein
MVILRGCGYEVPDPPLAYNTFGIVTSADDPTTAAVNDGDRPALEGVGNEFSPQRSYTGREPDHATGLIYYRARWFDSRTRGTGGGEAGASSRCVPGLGPWNEC